MNNDNGNKDQAEPPIRNVSKDIALIVDFFKQCEELTKKVFKEKNKHLVFTNEILNELIFSKAYVKLNDYLPIEEGKKSHLHDCDNYLRSAIIDSLYNTEYIINQVIERFNKTKIIIHLENKIIKAFKHSEDMTISVYKDMIKTLLKFNKVKLSILEEDEVLNIRKLYGTNCETCKKSYIVDIPPLELVNRMCPDCLKKLGYKGVIMDWDKVVQEEEDKRLKDDE